MNFVQPGTSSQRLLYLLRRPDAHPECLSEFCGQGHDDLLEQVAARIDSFRPFIDPGLSGATLQSLQDRGVDLLYEFSDDSRCAISLKSPFDIRQDDFTRSTKAQITEGTTYPRLEMYVLLLCPCPENEGVEEKCRQLQAMMAQSSRADLRIIPPERLAGFLFRAIELNPSELADEYRDASRVTIESTPYEERYDNQLRVRYLLCRDPQEAKRLVIDGEREHFPLSDEHATIQTPAFETFLSPVVDWIERRRITASQRIADDWGSIDLDSVAGLATHNRDELEAATDARPDRISLTPTTDTQLIRELLSHDSLSARLFNEGTPLSELVDFYAYYEPCGSAGVQIYARARKVEIVVLEVSPISEAVDGLRFYFEHKDRGPYQLGRDAERADMYPECVPFPPRILRPDESVLIPLGFGLAPFDQPEGEVVRRKDEVYPSGTSRDKQYDRPPVSAGDVVEERAISGASVFTSFGPTTKLNHISYVSREGVEQKVSVRALDRSNVLHVTEWLGIGCCPHLHAKTETRGWIELGTVLNRFVERSGVELQALPDDWVGELRFEERENEVTKIESIVLRYRTQDGLNRSMRAPLESVLTLWPGESRVVTFSISPLWTEFQLRVVGGFTPLGDSQQKFGGRLARGV